jgi:sirohydrochlorin ferrochelatase
MKHISRTILTIAILIADGAPEPVVAQSATPGFLVIAPDRGFLGNQEIQTVVEEFKKSYSPAALALVGQDYNGVGSEYSGYLSRALGELKQAGAREIVAIPLFLSKADPVLQTVMTHLPSYPGAETLRWAEPLAESYLTGQILLDRVETLSRDPEQERLLLAGFGATNEANEDALKKDQDRLLTYITQRKKFREARTLVYYDRVASGGEEKNKSVDTIITATAAKKGRKLLVPAAIGPKFDHMMALTSWLGEKFKELDVAYAGEELFPHPNLLLWLKKTANPYLPASATEIGVIIMPHGATQPYNDAVEQVIAPLRSRYRIEMAYGMGDTGVMQQAISRLEAQGVRRIVFVRMYALEHHVKDRVDYILGLVPPLPVRDHDHEVPAQVRSAALFATFGGYEHYSGMAEVLHERIMEISQDPSRETVILLAHGDKSDEGNATWLSVMQANIERLKRDPHCAKLRAIRAATVGEDWPELRERAVAEVRAMIQEAAKTGRVLVIADRLYGSGPYKKLLNGLDYVMNEKGLSHPVLTRWLEEGIGRMTGVLARPLAHTDRLTRQ